MGAEQSQGTSQQQFQQSTNQKSLSILRQGQWLSLGIRNDYNYGEVRIYQNQTNNQYIAVKSKVYQSEVEFNQAWSRTKKIQSLTQNVIGTVKLLDAGNISEGNFCSNYFKITQAFEYFDATVNDLIKSRIQVQKPFQRADIIDFLAQILSAIQAMELTKNGHGDLRPNRILLQQIQDENGIRFIYKLTEPEDQYRRLLLTPDPEEPCFLSPELLIPLSQHTLKFQYDRQSADVWCLGLVVLALGTLGNIQTIYDWETNSIFQAQLDNLIEVFQNYNGIELTDIIKKMFNPDPKSRPSFGYILEQIINFSMRQTRTQEIKNNQQTETGKFFLSPQNKEVSPANNRYSEKNNQNTSRPVSPPQYQYSNRKLSQQQQNLNNNKQVDSNNKRTWALEFLNDSDTKVHVPCNPDEEFLKLHQDELKNTYTNQFQYSIVDSNNKDSQPMQDQTNNPTKSVPQSTKSNKKVEKTQIIQPKTTGLKRPKTGVSYLSTKTIGTNTRKTRQQGSENKGII